MKEYYIELHELWNVPGDGKEKVFLASEVEIEIARLRKALEEIINMAWDDSGLIGKDHPDPEGNKFYRAFSVIGIFAREALAEKE